MITSFAAIKVMVVVLLALALPVIVVWTVVKVLQGLFWVLGGVGKGISATVRGSVGGTGFLIGHVFAFVRGMLLDALRFAGAMLTAGVILPLALLNFCIGRWGSAVHYGRALEDELASGFVNLYRVAVGHPIRLLGLGILTDGVERRLPDLVARAPEPRRVRRRAGRFDGYKVTGNLPPGGSGAQLYLARPLGPKLGQLRSAGHPDPGQVVIKAFALSAGSTLPQIVRESRALEAASRLGLVLEHELTDSSFHYVMPYVPGENLDVVIASMHAKNGAAGLSQHNLQVVMGYASDLLQTLDRFHAGGLWHKDIKPGNLIVSNNRVHLVDLGLVTPLQSAMTLTTHGTEYFRDPEMVRLAMKGVKVHEVDGVKFDIYSAGAVLYAMVENSFPAHGSLSRVSKRCPEALKWIVRRAMADMSARYAHSWEMLADLRALLTARDPFAVAPAELPSVRGEVDWSVLGPQTASESGALPPAPEPLRPVAEPELDGRFAFAGPGGLPTTRTVRRRTSRGLLAAGVWAALLATAVAGFASLAGRGKHYRPVLVQYRPEVPAISDRHHRATVQAGERTLALEEERWRGMQSLWSQELQPTLRDRRIAQQVGGGPEGPAVLLVADLGSGADRAVIQGLREFLEESGFQVFGGGGTAETNALEIELSAGARNAIGLGDPEDVESVLRLESFLGSRPELGAILWVATGRGENELTYRLLVRPEESVEEPRTLSLGGSPGTRQ